MDVTEISYKGMDWSNLAQDKQVAVSCEHGNESSSSQHVRGFSTSCRFTSFSRMTVSQEGAVTNICNNVNLTFVCIVSIIVNDDQQDATILAYLFIPNQLYMFWAMFLPIIRSTWLYLQHLILYTGIAAGWGTIADAVYTVKCSWWWAKTSPKICRAD
jgi:hypothetical protein